MKIIKHDTSNREGMMFTDVIKFEIPQHPLGTLNSVDQDLNQVCGWIANAFGENYVVMEVLDRRIAGGWGDKSKEGWKTDGSKVDRTDEPYPRHYELRCYSKDASWFLLKWSS